MTEIRKKQIATLKAWAKALRSGKYEQTQNVLREGTTNRMCCLGVLCDVVDPSGWKPDGKYGHNGAMPPARIARLAGITHDNRVVAQYDTDKFAELNDLEDATYEEIADVVDWMRYDLEVTR